MKKLLVISAMLIWGLIGTSESFANHGVSGYFYNNLSPYGSWIQINSGVVVWRPTIIRLDWSPYQDGRWIWTDDGWYWDSYEPYGNITYHYGRWYFDDYYGWLWYPDYDWAPAWVEWRYDDDYIGWAPLSPYASFSITTGIFFSYTYYAPYYHWHFVSFRHFCNPYVYNYYVPTKQKYRIYSNTKYRTNYGYNNGRIQNRGVDVNYIRVRSGDKITKRNIVSVRDVRELDKKHLDDNNVRTFIPSRDDLTRNERTDVKIQNDGRRTSLDVSKVKIGDRNRENSVTVKREEVNKNQNRVEVNKEINKRNNDVKQLDVNRTRTENNQKEKIILQKNDRNTETRVNDNRKQFDQKNKQKVKTETKDIKRYNTEQNKKKEVRTNTNTKKIEIKKDNNRSNDFQKKNTQVNRNSGNNNKNNVTKQNRQKTNNTGRTNNNNNLKKRK